MAKVTFEGLDELIKEMDRMHNEAEIVFDEMLIIGSEECKKSWLKMAKTYNHIDTGDMLKSIDYKIVERSGNAKVSHTYPQGKDRYGVRNASKAFWRHYGTSKKPGTYWVDAAEEDANPKILNTLVKRWTEHILGSR